jgi:hypothetical protein
MSLTINVRETADATILDMSGRIGLGEALVKGCLNNKSSQVIGSLS